MTDLPLYLREREALLRCVNKRVPLRDRLCAACAETGGRARHGFCTDPFGDQQHCYCHAWSETHRLVHEQWASDDHHDDADYDGSPISRRTVDRWEQGEAVYHERLIHIED